jgi:hypothetical protein
MLVRALGRHIEYVNQKCLLRSEREQQCDHMVLKREKYLRILQINFTIHVFKHVENNNYIYTIVNNVF